MMSIRAVLKTTIATVVCAGAMWPAQADASAIGICNNSTAPSGPDTVAGSNGTCQKTVTLDGDTLTIQLNNTTPVAFGGFLTADAFLLPAGVTATLESTTNTNFTLSQNPSVNPFDNMGGFAFNYLLSATSNDWEGGGNPGGGIAAGSSATFVLLLSGGLGNVTESGVLGSQAIRFRGFLNGGSDKDLITPGNGSGAGGGGGGGQVIPEPVMLTLFGVAMLGVAYRARVKSATRAHRAPAPGGRNR